MTNRKNEILDISGKIQKDIWHGNKKTFETYGINDF